LSFLL